MRVLISWGTDDNDNNVVGIDTNSGGWGGQIGPPSSRRHACRGADLLAKDASYDNFRTPPQGHGRWLAPCGPAAGTGVAPPWRAPGGDAGKGCIGAHPA